MSSSPSQYGRIARLLDQIQAQGQYAISLSLLAERGGLTPLAVHRQLEHLSPRVVRLPGRPASYLIVPPEHQARGAPPIAAWLDTYMRLRNEPYYVGLLSAAALHGSSQQAVQVTQVMVTRPLRPMVKGRLRVEFHVKSALSKTPVTSLPGLLGPLAVSSAEATALDLIAFSACIGGVSTAAQVIQELRPSMSIGGLRLALAAESRVPVKQRLGFVLESLRGEKLAAEVRKSLPSQLMLVPLQTHTPKTPPPAVVSNPWMVWDNIGFEGAQ